MGFKFRPLLYISVLFILIACKKEKPTPVTPLNQAPKPAQAAMLYISAFSEFPAEIEGCSCNFSNDSLDYSAQKFIYMNDFKQTSFLKVNGVLTKFTETSRKDVDSLNVISTYNNTDYEMIIKMEDKGKHGPESSIKTGTIKLTDKNGKTLEKAFYGECGC